jgi:hypothetical protein
MLLYYVLRFLFIVRWLASVLLPNLSSDIQTVQQNSRTHPDHPRFSIGESQRTQEFRDQGFGQLPSDLPHGGIAEMILNYQPPFSFFFFPFLG